MKFSCIQWPGLTRQSGPGLLLSSGGPAPKALLAEPTVCVLLCEEACTAPVCVAAVHCLDADQIVW